MSRVINKTRIILLAIITLFFSAFVSQTSLAKSSLSEEDEAMFSQNNILFYEPCDTQSSGGSSSEICGSNKNYAGVQVFTDSQMNAIKHFQPFYEKSAAKYGLPWELLAVLHYREHSLTKSNPDNGQGVYQLYSYTNGGKNANAFWPAGAISDDEFQRQTDIVARLISEGYGKGKNLNTDDGIKQTLFAFNGIGDGVVFEAKAKALGFTNPLEGSAYVMNKYDEQRDPSSPNVNSAWIGNYTSDGNWSAGAKDERWGTFTAYKALTCDGNSDASNDADDSDDVDSDDSTKPSCDAKIQGSKNINGTGAALAWPLGTKSEKYTLATGKVLESVLSSPGQTDTFSGTGAGTTLFQEAWIESGMSKNSMTNNREKGRYSWRYGAYCCGFTAVVVRYSGYDRHFNGSLSVGKYEQVNYAKKHPDLWDVETWDGKKSSLQGGDILVSSTHSWMVVEDESGELYRAEASLSQGHFGHISEYNGRASGTTYRIRATHANNSNVGVSVTNGVKSSSTNGTVTSSSQNSNDIGAAARYFAYPTRDNKAKSEPKEEAAWKTLLKNNGVTRFGTTNMGKDCNVFVSGVLRYAGATSRMVSRSNPNLIVMPDEITQEGGDWTRVDTDGQHASELQDGDVIYEYNDAGFTDLAHFSIFLRGEDGKAQLAEASHAKHYGWIGDFYSARHRKVYRYKKNKTGGGSSSSSECNLCPGEDESSDGSVGGTLQNGGFKTEDEADGVSSYEHVKLFGIITIIVGLI